MIAGIEVVHVAVVTAAAPDDELANKVAAAIGKSPYETRLRLTGKVPKIIANFDTQQKAELAARSLRDLGLVTVVISDPELRKPPQIFKVRSLKLEEQRVTFIDRAGQSKLVEFNQLFLILSARLQAYTEIETTRTKRKINVMATLVTGIPVPKKVEEKVTSKTFETESFLRLYDRISPDSAIEISQHGLDYSFLGEEMTSAAGANYGLAIKRLRAAFPQAIFDDSLIDPFGSKAPATMARDAIEANCKLIYWCHRAVTGTGTAL